MKLLGLSDDEDSESDELENGTNINDVSSETSSSPELEPQPSEKPEVSEPIKEPTEELPIFEPMEEIEQEIMTEEEHQEKLTELDQTIKVLQQQMAEGNDHIAYEMKMKHKSSKKSGVKIPSESHNFKAAFKPPRKAEKPKKSSPEKVAPKKSSAQKVSKQPSPEKMSQKMHNTSKKILEKLKSKTPEKTRKITDMFAPKKTPEKTKIKVRVELQKTPEKPNKNTKVETADTLVKLLVPFFKSGQIASKQVFKVTARELTHFLLKNSQLKKEDFSSVLKNFFDQNGTLLSEQDAKDKIAAFRQ